MVALASWSAAPVREQRRVSRARARRWPQQQAQPQQPYQQPYQQPQNPAVLEAIRIKNEYEADKNTPTDKWLKARGMTQAELDAALKLAASA